MQSDCDPDRFQEFLLGNRFDEVVADPILGQDLVEEKITPLSAR